MSRNAFAEELKPVLNPQFQFTGEDNFLFVSEVSEASNQNNTNEAFSKKWRDYKDSAEKESLIKMQKQWYLECYDFKSEEKFAEFLQTKKYIYDAGCGIGFKAAWFAQLAPESIVIGVDFSEASQFASEFYKDIPNLFFMRGDIANPIFKENTIDYVSCDQVIMHTEDPELTFKQLSQALKKEGQFACYFYAKKALVRELVDDYFRSHCTNMSHDELMEMSSQLTELGQKLSELNVSIDAPDIPALGIKGGKIDVQRFIYWNFLKCYWNPEMGEETSTMINFDWYSPTNAERYSKEEVEAIVHDNNLKILNFHEEEACYTGRFLK